MKIAVVHPDSGWVLSVISRRMCEAMPEVFALVAAKDFFATLTTGKLDAYDGVYYVDIQNCWNPGYYHAPPLGQAVHVGMMTHLDQDSPASFRPGWDKLDGVVHMAQRYMDVFHEQRWYRDDQMALIRPGEPCGTFPLRKIRLGVCQRGEHVGKGKAFLPEVLESLPPQVRQALALIFLGNGWLVDGQTDYHGVQASSLPEDNPKSYLFFYNLIDYLLVPSLWEGGPLAVPEALASGLPIIAADVGWVSELCGKVIDAGQYHASAPRLYGFPPGNANTLGAILTELARERVSRRMAVMDMTYRS